MNPELRAILVCPVDRQPLRDEQETLICTACKRHYPIIDGIPNMIPEDAEQGTDTDEHGHTDGNE